MSFNKNINYNSIFVRKRRDKFCVIGQYIGKDGKEKQKTLTSCATKEDAENEKIKIKAAILESRFITSPDATLLDRYERYYHDPLKSLAENTVNSAMHSAGQLAPILKIKLKDLDINSYRSILSQIYSIDQKESSKKTIASRVVAVVRECERNKEIPLITPYVRINRRNEIAAEEIEKADKRFSLNSEEVEKILNYTPKNFYQQRGRLFCYTYLETGIRFGELAGLKWDAVDFKKKQIVIKNNLQYINRKLVDKIPKGKKMRTISVSDKLLEVYREELEDQKNMHKLGALKKIEYVHLNTEFNPLNSHTCIRCVKKFMEAAGVEPCPMHTLRHTHATMLLKEHTPVTVVAKRLGHSKTSTTMDIYAHALEEDSKAAAGIIDQFID